MRLLLLGLTGAEPAFAAWRRWLTRAGVPFHAVACKDISGPLEFIAPTPGPSMVWGRRAGRARSTRSPRP
jgi:hypothetical protein